MSQMKLQAILLDSYLAEFLWRNQLNSLDAFEVILKDISEFWPPS